MLMGTQLIIAALGLFYVIYQGNATQLVCREFDTSILRKGVYIRSEVGRDGRWLTHAHGYKVYKNETVFQDLKINFDVTGCGNMAVVFPTSRKPDPNAPAGNDIILIDPQDIMGTGSSENIRDDINQIPWSDQGVKGSYQVEPTSAAPSQKQGYLRIYSRKEWGASDLSHELTKLYTKPPNEVIIGDTQSGPCNTREECAQILRGRQTRSKYGMFVNFMVGNGGMIFEGRGWDYESGRPNTFIIDVIGSYMHKYPPKVEMYACHKLIKYGIKIGKIDRNYKLYMAKDIGWGVK